jgi:hypothetical protein
LYGSLSRNYGIAHWIKGPMDLAFASMKMTPISQQV